MRLTVLLATATCLLAYVELATAQSPPRPLPTPVLPADSISIPTGKADSILLARIAFRHGSDAYRLAQMSKRRKDFQKAISFLEISDELDPTDDAKFLWGAAAFSIAQSATVDAKVQKSCELAQLARDTFVVAQTNLSAGTRKHPMEAEPLLTAIPQFFPAVSDQLKRFCK
jgi:hypothetical protein